MRYGAVSRVETTSTIVLSSQVPGDQSSAAIPEVESRPETEFAPDVEHPAEVEITVAIIDEGDLGSARPGTTEKLFNSVIRNKINLSLDYVQSFHKLS